MEYYDCPVPSAAGGFHGKRHLPIVGFTPVYLVANRVAGRLFRAGILPAQPLASSPCKGFSKATTIPTN